jgi:NADH-quinone oxidoreductase subunit L
VGFLNIDFAGFAPVTVFQAFLQPVVGIPAAQASHLVDGLALLAGVLLSLLGLGVAWAVYGKQVLSRQWIPQRLPWLYQLSFRKFYWDEVYDVALVTPVLALATGVRRVLEPGVFDSAVGGVRDAVAQLSADLRTFQTGFLKDYALWFFFFAVLGVVLMGLRLT